MIGSMPVVPDPERHVFPLPATLGGVAVSLSCVAWRYPISPAGTTLILTHGISGHKEQYHTTITRLLSLRDGASYDIREIWSLDFPNHGESATLNRHLLDDHKAGDVQQGISGTCTTIDCAAHLHSFLSLPRFRGHTIIGIAHSGSCTVWVHALTKFAPAHRPNPHALILVEPTLMFPHMSPTDPRSIHGAANVRGALTKRDTWSCRAEFRRWVIAHGKSIWGRWDPRVLDLYVEHALEEVMVPTTTTSGGQALHTYVTPRIRKDEEASLYACLAHTIEPCQLGEVCMALNESGRRGVHIIWAEYEEFISKTAKAEIADAAQHRIATQRTVVGSGHLVPQLKPDALADAVHEVLGKISSSARSLL